MNDKIKHIIAGVIIAGLTYWLAITKLGLNENDSGVTGIGVAILAAVIKEFYDTKKSKPTGFDKMDILATIVGAMFTVIALIIIF